MLEGRHLNAGPSVPGANPTMGTVAGSTFLGTSTVATTASGWPTPLVDKYMICQAFAGLSSGPDRDGRERMTSPGAPAGSGLGGTKNESSARTAAEATRAVATSMTAASPTAHCRTQIRILICPPSANSAMEYTAKYNGA